MNTPLKTTAAILIIASLYATSCAHRVSTARGPVGGSSQDTTTFRTLRFFGPVGGSSPDTMLLQQGSSTVAVTTSDIVYLEVLGNRTNVVTADRNYMTMENLKRFTDVLPKDQFVQVHRNYAVARKSITGFEDGYVLVGTTKVPTEKAYRKAIQDLLPGNNN